MQTMRERVIEYITQLQETIVTKLESYSPGQMFRREPWARDEGGGGLSCTFPPPDTPSPIGPIEKAGVNISRMSGILPPAAIKQMSTAHAALKHIDTPLSIFAASLSVIIHPHHPRIPSVHANYRYFEVLDTPLTPPDEPTATPTVLAWWFGAITDLTPAYLNAPDFGHFHGTLKGACDAWSDPILSIYPTFKASCDAYLYIPHRHEHRGIGGIRFDDMDSDAMRALLGHVAAASASAVSLPEDTLARLSGPEALFDLVKALGDTFLPSFIPILERHIHIHTPVIPAERRWQLLRRGRYVEFNLVVDRGTKFGLAAPGVRAENVLVSMPAEARWEDRGALGQDTEEAAMVSVLKEPRSWVE